LNQKHDVWQGTLALMILKTLNALGHLHGYGIARRIEQTSENQLAINYGTIINGGAIIDHETPFERRIVAVEK